MSARILPALAVAFVALWASGEARAYCSEPLVPYCLKSGAVAEDGVLSDRECRGRVTDYIRDLERYATCLSDQLTQTEADIERFRALIAEPPAEPQS